MAVIADHQRTTGFHRGQSVSILGDDGIYRPATFLSAGTIRGQAVVYAYRMEGPLRREIVAGQSRVVAAPGHPGRAA